ncbi:LOW QUALITY PROTEIN: DNA annealing helicase and endonuclease ZRANB3-like [Oncorhynchus keta]|uniref:LOW QUALITY PROTEIN: DNA annealing helicase and endonuclease ZRANB3-like n=1 Tax=Oncorhynchus keta TaxID=8018 RepID=UPI00227AD4AE|nr:LOW QUALITY PROTEIN: DNA annealing helicase and endonuclease ZRANB3-like [Oncorhynchus keta]
MWGMLNRKETVTGSTLNGKKEYLKAELGDKDKWDFLNFAEAWTPSETTLAAGGVVDNDKDPVFFNHFEKDKQHDIRSFFSPDAGKEKKRKRTEGEVCLSPVTPSEKEGSIDVENSEGDKEKNYNSQDPPDLQDLDFSPQVKRLRLPTSTLTRSATHSPRSRLGGKRRSLHGGRGTSSSPLASLFTPRRLSEKGTPKSRLSPRPGPPDQGKGDQWSCGACTYSNSILLLYCEVCESPLHRPSTAPDTQSTGSPAVSPGSRTDQSTPREHTWIVLSGSDSKQEDPPCPGPASPGTTEPQTDGQERGLEEERQTDGQQREQEERQTDGKQRGQEERQTDGKQRGLEERQTDGKQREQEERQTDGKQRAGGETDRRETERAGGGETDRRSTERAGGETDRRETERAAEERQTDGKQRGLEERQTDGQQREQEERQTDGQQREQKERQTDGQQREQEERQTDGQQRELEERQTDGQQREQEERQTDGQQRELEERQTDGKQREQKERQTDGQQREQEERQTDGQQREQEERQTDGQQREQEERQTDGQQREQEERQTDGQQREQEERQTDGQQREQEERQTDGKQREQEERQTDGKQREQEERQTDGKQREQEERQTDGQQREQEEEKLKGKQSPGEDQSGPHEHTDAQTDSVFSPADGDATASLPLYPNMKFCASKNTERIYLYSQEDSPLHWNFIPLDIKLDSWEDLPEAFRRRENRTQILRFVQQWSTLTAMKQRLIRRSGLLFCSPVLVLDQLTSTQRKHSSTKRYLTKEDVSQASLSKAQCDGGTVRMVNKEIFFTKRRTASMSRPNTSASVPEKLYKTNHPRCTQSLRVGAPEGPSEAEAGYLQVLDSEGRPLCLSCHKVCGSTGGAWDTCFCSQTCQEEFQLRSSQAYMRARVLQTEQGVCQSCGLQAHQLYLKGDAPPTHRKEMLENTWLAQLSLKQLNEMIRAPAEGQFWQVDHIRPVYSGGGQCSLDNLQTLCTVCHRTRTAQQAKDRSQMKKGLAASKVASDITRFFIKK